ncbi:hypothetical protein GZH47_20265 [Paenibacillus rhizovicinus]|uniref:DUF5808 domain-containing protein n=1 Tax=Paenibacillus rhizovicinus TaxID=2704463 RepID=A0A6C0P384_9BACL|nr:DUF5808 domain-containing protein [Paenibacillus rhizovicinus]QHW32915.1 hypothetical protein GZH47_20265 [Paenibacillus rhizovicinus]
MLYALSFILLIPIIICYIAIWVTYKPQAAYRNGMLFAVTLPAHAMENEDIQRIRTRFNEQFRRASWRTGAALIPFVLLYMWPAYQITYFFVWLSAFFFVMAIPFRGAFRATLALKREHEWFVGAKRVIRGDLRVARLKNAQAASPWLFAIPLAMAIGTLVWAGSADSSRLWLAGGGLVFTLICLLIFSLMRRSRASVYSENSEVNMSLNQARRRSLSYLWLYMAIVENIHFILLLSYIMNDTPSLDGIWLAALLIFAILPAGIAILTYRHIDAQKSEVLRQDGQVIYSDDDEYWSNGFTYHNPDDRTIMVPKRVGIGETVNTATWTGKIIIWGTIGIAAAAMFFASFMLIRSELTSPTLTFSADRRIEINYPMYTFDFNIDDMEELKLVDDPPGKGSKMNGEATNKVARGKFRLNGLGPARLYIFKNDPPYIRIKLKDTYIFYNDKDPEQTKLLFEQLRQSRESGQSGQSGQSR